MGVSVLILGHSGSGKSTSLRNFEPGEIGVFNVASKPLPFRKKLQTINHAQYNQIHGSLSKNALRAYVIDDANYLMAFQSFAKAKENGYGKFTDMAVNFKNLLDAANGTNEDTMVYFLMHPDYDESGRMKAKTIGKMLDNQLTVEGMFPIVLVTHNDDGGYFFLTKSDGTNPVKAPMGMLDEGIVENDLKLIDSRIREYWNMRPLVGDQDD